MDTYSLNELSTSIVAPFREFGHSRSRVSCAVDLDRSAALVDVGVGTVADDLAVLGPNIPHQLFHGVPSRPQPPLTHFLKLNSLFAWRAHRDLAFGVSEARVMRPLPVTGMIVYTRGILPLFRHPLPMGAVSIHRKNPVKGYLLAAGRPGGASVTFITGFISGAQVGS